MTKDNQFMEDFENYAKQMIGKYKIPGVAIGINENSERVYERGFGYRNKEEKVPVTLDTVFGIASITKSFTCVAIMQLQEAGKLSVSDQVIRHLPEFHTADKEQTKQMTIHHFMSNSSGLPPLASEEDLPVPIESYEEFMKFIGEQTFDLLGAPGEEFSYSNHAFGMLGAVIERVSGQTYENYIKEHILERAGMMNSSIYLSDLAHHDDITKLYEAKQVRGITSVYPLPEWKDIKTPQSGAGFLKSTVNDMLKYTEIFRNEGLVGSEQILSPESVKQMTYPHMATEPGEFYGYGLIVTPDYYGTTLIEHSGSMDGIASLMCIVPEKGLTSVILTNLAGVPSGHLLMSAMNSVQGKEIATSPIVFNNYEESKENLLKYVGTYESAEGMKVVINMYGGKLTFYSGGAYHPIRQVDEHLFAIISREQETTVKFIVNDNQEVIRLFFHYRQLLKKD